MYEVDLLPAQKEYFEIPHNNPIDVAVYQGGFGSGKTFCGSLLGIIMCIKYPGIVGLVGALTVPILRDTTLATYIEHLDNLGLTYIHNKTEECIVFPNKSKILFRHLQEPNKLKSLNLGFVEIEEMSDVPLSTFQMLLSRLRQKAKPEWNNFRHRLFGHTNPQQSRGWIYQYFKLKPPPGYRRILAPTIQNIHLPEGYIDLLRNSYNEFYFKINVEGEDCEDTTGLVTKGFNHSLQVKEDLEIDVKYPIHITCDFNVDPMCWYVCQIIDNKVNILYEMVKENTTTDSAAQVIADLLAPYKNKTIIINGDASGNSETTKGVDYVYLKNCLTRNNFTNVTLKIMAKNPGIEYRISCWNNMILGPDNQPHIFIHPQCKYLLYNIENQEVEPGTSRPKRISSSKIKTDPQAKYLGHPIDAVSYLVCLYFPVKQIRVQDFKDSEANAKRDIFGGKFDKRLI